MNLKGIFLLLFFFYLTIANATVYYVDGAKTDNTGNGTSWATAKKDVQAAINLAINPADQIWVKAGTYYPTTVPGSTAAGSNSKDYSFYVTAGVQLYGGFAGNETLLSQRNAVSNITVLSGDIGNTPNDNSDNCYHVVIVNGSTNLAVSAIIDGFTVTAGNAIGTGTVKIGSGSSTKVIYQNQGGGLNIYSGQCTISHCIVNGNFANSGGAGIFSYYCTITVCQNYIVNNNAGVTTSSCIGGGIYIEGSTINTVVNNIISGNAAGDGGGLAIYGTNTATTVNITANIIAYNTFYNNSASKSGGGLRTHQSYNTIENNIFWGNSVTATTNPDRTSDYRKGNNSMDVFINNSLQQVSSNYKSTNFNDLGAGSLNNIFSSDPLFANTSSINYSKMGLQPLSTSPCIGKGVVVTAIGVDILGISRSTTAPTIGAYESSGSFVIYVDSSLSVGGDGTSWAKAFKSLADALDVANKSQCVKVINVAKGTYLPTHKPYNGGTEISTNDPRDVCFSLKNGLAMYGGYAPGGGSRDIKVNPTVLSGDIGISNNISDNCYHVLLVTSASTDIGADTINGFTVVSGNSNGNGSITINSNQIYQIVGAGINMQYGIRNSIINCIISGNNSALMAGGIYVYEGSTIVSSSFIVNNTSLEDGTGITVMTREPNSYCNIYNCVIAGNAGGRNGGVYLLGESTSKTDTLAYNTIYNNSSAGVCGGLYSRAPMIVYNTIFWMNAANGNQHKCGSDYLVGVNGSAILKNNLLQLVNSAKYSADSGNQQANLSANNIYASDPLFTSANSGNYSKVGLQPLATSPCMGKGVVVPAIANDIFGKRRSITAMIA